MLGAALGAWHAAGYPVTAIRAPTCITLMSRLLLIDDDTRLTDMVGGYLRQNGY